MRAPLPFAIGAAVGALLAASPTARADERGPPLSIGDPARPLLLRPRLAVDVRPAEGPHRGSSGRPRISLSADRSLEGSAPAVPAPAGWRAVGTAWIQETAGSGWSAILRAIPDGVGVALEAEIHYSAAMVVAREAIVVRLPGRARALGRDLRIAPLVRPLRIDRGTPVWLATSPTDQRPGAAVVGEQGVVAARFAPRGADTDVEIVADDPASHPFRTYAACRSVHVGRGAGEATGQGPAPLQRVSRDRITRAAGEVVRARAHVYLVEPGREFQPIIVERWARGARAAVAFADHADRTDPEALAALLHGVSDRAAPEFGRAGFFAHHIKITKTFFLRPGLGTLEDPDTRRLADELAAHGSEVGSHSITPLRDLRADVMASLGGLSPWKVVTWIDHQPDTNCEAISSRGWRDDPTYGIHDVLAAAGFQWVWSASDVPLHAIQVRNVFEPERAAAALPPIYPLPADTRLWVFESSWFYGPTERMAAAFSDAELDRLEDQRGLFVGHTYLAASPRTTRRRDLIARDAVVPRAQGGLAIDPGIESALARLEARAAAGALASLTVRDSSERLRDLAGVVVRYRADGSALISNVGSRRIEGLTLAIPASVEPEVDGAAVGGVRSELGRTTLWIDLPAGATVAVAARWPAVPGHVGGERAPLGAAAPAAAAAVLP